ncbi:S9 family peptidase [Oscillatoriales cyanobacterium LEGE 11467]|uniref:S9 family peptidase n=1 Tax=Zarconia navalis LEGE 11467 TaxID=1828826 RepID=A0A928Z8J5_9CYAN|nr:S9 family peptidase [Zarconia navalis]MBE9039911.1 S9 family peptidase [Zarconia navalis LEGE 11467]
MQNDDRHDHPRPPIIDRQILFGNPKRTSPQLSPDGRYLTYIAPDEEDVLQVWLQEIGQKGDRQLTHDPKRGIRFYLWTYDPQKLLYLQDTDGDENFHLYAVNIHTNDVRDLTPFPEVKVQPLDLDPNFPNEILVGLNLENPQTFDVYRIDLASGEVQLDTKNPGNIVDWTPDDRYRIRAALAATPDGGYDLLFRETIETDWEILRHWNGDDQGYAVGFSADGNTLYLVGNRDANAKRLIALDLSTRHDRILAEDAEYDVAQIVVQPNTRSLQAVSFYKDRLEWQVLDKSIAEDFQTLANVRKGEFRVVSRDLEDNTWLVSYLTDDGPVYYYTYDRASQTATFLFCDRPELEGLPLVPMHPISYEARDGLTLHGYLTLPMGGEVPLASVILVHGGPWARDTWGYHPTVQWLANRGYAVLQVNFRGSTGYGKAFLNAGNREWARKMHDDLLDGVNWLVEKGISDRTKIAIMGGSYGGYATLVGLTFTPDVFACGVDIVGPSNLVTLMESIPPYWEPQRALFARRLGDITTEAEFLKSRSPLFLSHKIEKPLLIGQGANDPRVKQAESEQIVEAMDRGGKPVKYVLYTDEGHGFARPANRLHFYAIAEEFLAQYLDGQFQPMDEIEGHSGMIRST